MTSSRLTQAFVLEKLKRHQLKLEENVRDINPRITQSPEPPSGNEYRIELPQRRKRYFTQRSASSSEK